MASFQKGDSEESVAFLKEVGSLSTIYVQKSSPKNVRILVILLLLSSASVVGAELEEEILEVEGVQEGSLGILNLKRKMFSK